MNYLVASEIPKLAVGATSRFERVPPPIAA